MKGPASYLIPILGALALPALGFVPSSIEKTIYNNDNSADANHSATTRSYFDGLGREIRTVAAEGSGDVVSAIQYDDAGRPVRVLKPYYSTTHSHGWVNFTYIDLEGQASLYYDGSWPERPASGGVPYSETKYAEDPTKRPVLTASPGSAFSSTSGRVKKFWRVGVATPTFLSNPTEAGLNALTDAAGSNYQLEVAKNEDNRYSQVIKDAFGRTIKTWSDPSTAAGNEIITENLYDTEGRLVKTLLPGPNGAVDPSMAVTYTYSTDGKLLEEVFPDEGKTEYRYDGAGRLRLKRDSRDAAKTGYYTSMTYYKYDMHGRKIEEGQVEFPTSNIAYYFNVDRLSDPAYPIGQNMSSYDPKKRWYYDNLKDFDSNLNIPVDVDVSPDPYARGKIVATVAYNSKASQGSGHVMKFLRYDSEGRVLVKSISIPGVPCQTFQYSYDLQGRVVGKVHLRRAAGAPAYSYTTYEYDAKGRMVKMTPYNSREIVYTYDPTGKLKEKVVGGLISEKRAYSIRDWLKTLDVKNLSNSAMLYSEQLFYEDAPMSPDQWSGNISAVNHRYYSSPSVNDLSHWYGYDGANRLVSTTGMSTNFHESMSYDAKGRIVTKAENGASYGPYEYAPGKNQVVRVANHPTRSNLYGAAVFYYDERGNMVYDRSKMMAVEYDYNHMPVRFIHYNSHPAVGNWIAHTDVKSTVEMLYDVDDQRVLKRTVTP